MKPLPPCFYPTTVVAVDDDALFLEKMKSHAIKKSILYQTYINPRQALEYVNGKPFHKRIEPYITEIDGQHWLNYAHEAHIVDLRNIANDPKRFEDVSVVILDYDMPMMNGLEVAQNITNPHIKIILLTGIADEQIAIDAFHKGLIHAYVRKDDIRLLDTLHNHIVRLQRDYFSELFSPITDTIKTNAIHLKHLVHFPGLSAEYREIFEQCLRQHHIVEYYLCEGSGTSLLMDSEGNAYGFFIRTEDDFEMIENHDQFYEQPESIQNRFLKKEIMFCNDWKFHNFADHKSWPALFKKSKRIDAARPFYWACHESLLSINAEGFLSYRQYTKHYQVTSR